MAIVVLLVLGGSAWVLHGPAKSNGPETAPSNEAPSSEDSRHADATGAPHAAVDVTSRSTVAATPAARAPSQSASAHAMQLAAIETQWCIHGAQTHQQAMAALKSGHPSADIPLGGHWNDPAVRAASDRYHDARRALPTEQARKAVEERLVKSWVDALLRRGDLKGRATAHYLGATSPHLYSEREQHTRQLMELARSSPDPFLARLWQKLGENCHGKAYCQGPPSGHWAAIEPANALAWLPEWNDKQPLSAAQWQGLAQARYARAPAYLLQTLLLEQVSGLREGLALEVALDLIEHLGSAWDLDQTVQGLLGHCKAPSAAHRAVCLHAANLYWDHSHPSLIARMLLLRLVHSLQAENEFPWSERLAALKAMNEEEAKIHLLDAHYGSESDRQPGCAALPARRERLRDQAEGGVWLAAQRRLSQR